MAILLLCLFSTINANSPVIKPTLDDESVRHFSFSIMTHGQKTKTQGLAEVWICDKPDFFIKQYLSVDPRTGMCKVSYYNGSLLITGWLDESKGIMENMIAYDVSKIDKSKNPDHCAFYFSTTILPCVYSPTAKTKMNKYTFDIEKMLKVKPVEDKGEFRVLKSSDVTLSFSKKDETLKQLHFKKGVSELFIINEGENDVTGYNRDIILRHGKQTFGFEVKDGKVVDNYLHKDEDLLFFAKSIYP